MSRQTKLTLQLLSVAAVFTHMVKFLLWCIVLVLVLVLCWPLALLTLLLYPFVWLVLLPFRIVGIALDGVLGLLRGIVMLPARMAGGFRHA